MQTRAAGAFAVGILVLCLPAGSVLADYDVRVDLKNVSGEVKTNWPVILRVYTVLGRDLQPGSVHPDGFHVYDPAGAEVPHAVEKIPPYDQPGNDEIVFLIPKIKPGEVLSYRLANTAERSARRVEIDVVNSPHNLIRNGDFEADEESRPAGFAAPARSDAKVAHTGKSSLMLTAEDQTVSTKYARSVPLHKGSWYYFGVWSKTEKVARFGYQAGSAAHVRIYNTRPDEKDPNRSREVAALGGWIPNQCSTRDWLKVTTEGEVTEWGNDRYAVQAAEPQATVAFVLQQRRHFYMQPGETRGTWWLDGAVLMEQPEVNARFDLSLKPLMKDGVFLFTRPPSMPLGRLDEMKRGQREWCARPYAHEKLTRLEKFALKGQRVSFCVGVYHAREIENVLCRLTGGALRGPARAGAAAAWTCSMHPQVRRPSKGRCPICRMELIPVAAPQAGAGGEIPVELIEYCPGYLGPDRGRYMKILNSEKGVEPVTLAGEEGVRYFFLTFRVPQDAPAGKYTGNVEIVLGKPEQTKSIPLALRVQEMAQPTPGDVLVGIIYQGGNPRFDEEGLTVYARSNFNCITRFGNFLDYEKDEKGNWQVDLDKLHQRMMWLKGHGMAAVSIFSDFDLGPKWDGGALLKRTRPAEFSKPGLSWGDRLKTGEQAWKAQIKRIEAARKAHPEWPKIIYMTWDEPNLRGGRNGRPDPAMAWLNQVAPDAMTTLDVQFNPLPACIKWYTVPAFDDPADWAGPELYRWIKRQGRRFGFCGAADKDEAARYQAGMMMIATGATYFHAWHLTGGHIAGQVAYDGQTKKLLRAPTMINWGDGMNDLRCHHLLELAIREGRNSGDAKKLAAVKAAEAYLAKVAAVFNGDHRKTWTLQPYLGTAYSWGCEQFYDDWQEQMARHAAAIQGVQWID